MTIPLFTFTFMHLAEAFIQSDSQWIQVINFLSVCVFHGYRTHNLCAANAMLYHWATGTHSFFKGIVHPKIKILLSITLPQVVPNLYKFLSSLGHKRGYFWRTLVTERVMFPIFFVFKYYGSQWEPMNCLFANILQNIFFCVPQKKEMHTLSKLPL